MHILETNGTCTLSLNTDGCEYIMTDSARPMTVHGLFVTHTNIDRLNAHWAGFCETSREHAAAAPATIAAPAADLAPRRAAGVTLSYEGGHLYVTSFGYSASLTCAANEGELSDANGNIRTLSAQQQRVVDQWDDLQDAYYEANGWAYPSED